MIDAEQKALWDKFRVAFAEIADEHYGIRMFSHEENWGWAALGWHDDRRLIAAVSACSRDLGVHADLREELRHAPLEIERKIAVNLEENPEGEFVWAWAPKEFVDAGVQMTVVTL